MKHYLFITYGIQGVGGGQCYVASKAKYLESIGWHVVVFSEGFSKSKRKCPIDYLNKYIPDMIPELGIPLFKIPSWKINLILSCMRRHVGEIAIDDDIFIESHDDRTALWGELLAKSLNARHFFYSINERFRGEDKYYKEKMDFFLFKYKRNEIISCASSINRLFEGYLTVGEEEVESIWLDEDPVQDIISSVVEEIRKYDYNICYIGRAAKSYVPNIIQGVGEFSSKNKGKKVQFIVVSDSSSLQSNFEDVKSSNDNLIITELGTLHPLPKSLFSKVDVVIAGSGSARCSVEEGALTIVADPESKQALGILGYDTNNSVYKDEYSVVSSFSEALDRVLIKKVYKQMRYKYPPKLGVAECTKHNFLLMEKGDKNRTYYDEKKLKEGPKDYKLLINCLIQRIRFI